MDQFALPEGRYTLTVRLEEAKTRALTRTVAIEEDGHAVSTVDVETDDREVAVDLAGCDEEVQRVLDASSFNQQDAVTWLKPDTTGADLRTDPLRRRVAAPGLLDP